MKEIECMLVINMRNKIQSVCIHRSTEDDQNWIFEETKLDIKIDKDETLAFNTKFALISLFIHFLHMLLGPVGLFMINLKCRTFLLRNMIFRVHIVYFLTEMVQWMTVLSAMVVYVLLPSTFDKLAIYIFAMTTVIVFRNTLISCKYGTFSEKQWEEFNKRKLSFEEITSTLVINSWINIEPKTVEKELKLVYERLSINPDDFKLKFKSAFSELEEEGNFTQISEKIVMQSAVKMNKKTRVIMLPFAALYAAVPFVYTFLYSSFDYGLLEIALVILYTIESLIFCQILFLLVLATLLDYSRRLKLQKFCTSLISHNFNMCQESSKLDLRDHNTVIAWYYMRKIFMDFGRQFSFRLSVYNSISLPICLSVIVFLFLVTFGVIGEEYVPIYIPTIYFIIVLMVILVLIISVAVRLNRMFSVQRDALFWQLTNITLNSDKSNEYARNALWVVIEQLRQDENLIPVKVLGIKITKDLFSKLLAVSISALIIIIRLIV